MKPTALTRAATITVAWIAFSTIVSELSAPFKGLLTTIGGHHWIGKSVLSIVFFALFYFVFSKVTDTEFSLKETWWLLLAVLLGGLAILIFYVMHA